MTCPLAALPGATTRRGLDTLLGFNRTWGLHHIMTSRIGDAGGVFDLYHRGLEAAQLRHTQRTTLLREHLAAAAQL
jgi:hypothetical protein